GLWSIRFLPGWRTQLLRDGPLFPRGLAKPVVWNATSAFQSTPDSARGAHDVVILKGRGTRLCAAARRDFATGKTAFHERILVRFPQGNGLLCHRRYRDYGGSARG